MEYKDLEIVYKDIDELKPFKRNPKEHPEVQIKNIAKSIEKYGWRSPLLINMNTGDIIAGHGRVLAARRLGIDRIPCIDGSDMTEDQIAQYRYLDNKLNESDWDMDILSEDWPTLDFSDFDLDWGIEEEEELKFNRDNAVESLADKYVVPPMSVLDSRQGYWQDRKKKWLEFIHSGDGRDENLLGSGLNELIHNSTRNTKLNGTSVFDPVLCETLLAWFCPEGGKVIDPFAGGSVRGLVSSFVGRDYTGIDLRQEQIDANEDAYAECSDMMDFNGGALRHPTWITGDSADILTLAPGEYDFLLTCPPYADLEQYSKDPRDLSNMEYADFRAAYFDIIKKSVSLLKDNTYAAIVVGEVRDKCGYYYNFISDTIQAFAEAGMNYYNECILINNYTTAALRAEKVFGKYRKVVKVHQNVLVFVKGNEKEIHLSRYDYDFPED